ncbi:hypothetical protein C8Q75DRAFT_863063 [Abortiporus biennis]|nr:hypothetical protein C8Q75DRAFT_863063 [Abortiporus biennis]
MGARELSGFLPRRVVLRTFIHDYRVSLCYRWFNVRVPFVRLLCFRAKAVKLLKFLTSAGVERPIPDIEEQDLCSRSTWLFDYQKSWIGLAQAAFWYRSMFNGSGYFRSSDPDLWNHSFRPHHTAQSSLPLTVTTNPMVRLTFKAMTRFSIVSAD